MIKEKTRSLNRGFFFSRADNLYPLLVSAVAFITYFAFYQCPNYIFWDENYHIVSAQKYLDRVMFMEPHPPLGKLLIALGELIVSANKNVDTSSLLTTDYIKELPKGYSFAGVRLFPALFAMLCAPLFYFILARATGRKQISFFLSSLYLFENALIVHSKGAMLDSIQLFFILLCIYLFIVYFQKSRAGKNVSIAEYLYISLAAGFGIATKLTAMIVLLLFPVLFISDYLTEIYKFNKTKIFPVKKIPEALGKVCVSAAGIALIFCIVFYIHFALGQETKNGFYMASEEYKEILKNKETANPLKFMTMMSDSILFFHNYEKGVPKYDPNKKDENGSLALTWPFMNKTISYRWNKYPSGKVAYLYLVGNPIIWLAGLCGVIFSFVLILGTWLYRLKIENKELFSMIIIFTGLYLAYMIPVLQIQRVMYLYHYFVPLIFSLVLFGLQICYIFEAEIRDKQPVFMLAFYLFIGLVFVMFLYYAPFSYYIPLSAKEFLQRAFFSFWGMSYV